MSNIIWMIIPWVLLLGIYIYIFSRKRESERMKRNLKNIDWMTLLAIIFGGVVLTSAWDTSSIPILKEPWVPMVPILLIVVLFIVAIMRKARSGKPVIQIIGDERIEMIYAKSSRNALFITYLALFVHHAITEANTLDTNWLLIMLASGILVLFAWTIVYYYRKS